MKAVRCAIYTRKSSDEGLDQSFNSLDAQREACAAYILSQASEGWIEVKEHYDDGGLSGGTLERPALQRLLADVAANRVDIIVVYKVDRLTRSLLDFAKLVEAFDKAGVSFVSITQSFNTTTSMGRLTLNMLLSFAQFEREVTAERIRDKIAASKAKGMWMGDTPPLGYAPNGRTLKIVPEHADLVSDIYRRYLALGSVRLVQEALQADGIRLPIRKRHTSDQAIGGGWFSRGQLYKILSNPIYTGVVTHKEQTFPGLHPAIVDQATWNEVQRRIAEQRKGSAHRTRAASPSLLAGKIVDAAGEPLIATHATKGKVRYRYYVSRGLHHGTSDTGMRVPAREIEQLASATLAELFSDPIELAATAWLDLTGDRLRELEEHCRIMHAELQRRHSPALTQLITAVRINDDGVEISCDTAAVTAAVKATANEEAPATISLAAAARLTRSGRAVRLVHDRDRAPVLPPDRSLVRLVLQARGWWAILRQGELTIADLAEREKLTASYVTRVLRLAFLSPELIKAILAGKQPASVDVRSLTLTGTVAAKWKDQLAAAS